MDCVLVLAVLVEAGSAYSMGVISPLLVSFSVLICNKTSASQSIGVAESLQADKLNHNGKALRKQYIFHPALQCQGFGIIMLLMHATGILC